MENGNPPSRCVHASSDEWSGLADCGNGRWPRLLCHLCGRSDWKNPLQRKSIPHRQPGTTGQRRFHEYLRDAFASDRAGASLRSLRQSGHGVSRHQDRQSNLETQRSAVSSLSRRVFVASVVRESFDPDVRRRGSAIPCRTRQENRRDDLENQSLGRVERRERGNSNGKGRRFTQSPRHAADCDG